MAIPTGYPERAEEWATGAQLGMRWQISFQLANGNLPGVRARVGERAEGPGPHDAASVSRIVTSELLGGEREGADATTAAGSPAEVQATRAAIESQLSTLRVPRQRWIHAVAMALSSPEFQRQ